MSGRCVYRHIFLNNNKPEDDDTATIEHIVQWSIGGSDSVTIDNVSKRANSDLGTNVDAPFADLLPLAIKRFQLKIKNQKGVVRPIVWDVKNKNGVRNRLVVNPDYTTKFELPLEVTKEEDGDVSRFSGDRSVIEAKLKEMIPKLMKKGKAVTFEGVAVSNAQEIINRLKGDEFNEFGGSLVAFNHEIWCRGILKIVYGLVCKLVGPDWAFDKSAELYRGYINNNRDQWPTRPIRGTVAGEWPRAIRVALGKTAEVRARQMHTIALLPHNGGDRIFAAISLFGGDNVPEALIEVPGVKMLETQPPDFIMGYRIDPTTRKANEITIKEIDRNAAVFGPSNKRSLEALTAAASNGPTNQTFSKKLIRQRTRLR